MSENIPQASQHPADSGQRMVAIHPIQLAVDVSGNTAEDIQEAAIEAARPFFGEETALRVAHGAARLDQSSTTDPNWHVASVMVANVLPVDRPYHDVPTKHLIFIAAALGKADLGTSDLHGLPEMVDAELALRPDRWRAAQEITG